MFFELISVFLFRIRFTELSEAFDVGLSSIAVPSFESGKISDLIESRFFITSAEIDVRDIILLCPVDGVSHHIFAQWSTIHEFGVKEAEPVVQELIRLSKESISDHTIVTAKLKYRIGIVSRHHILKPFWRHITMRKSAIGICKTEINKLWVRSIKFSSFMSLCSDYKFLHFSSNPSVFGAIGKFWYIYSEASTTIENRFLYL